MVWMDEEDMFYGCHSLRKTEEYKQVSTVVGVKGK